MFYDRLKALCKNKNTTITNMLKDLDLSTGSTGNWKKGQLPKGEILAKIANYLDSSIDYIVFGEYRFDFTNDEKKLLEMFRSLPNTIKYKLLCDFEDLVKEELEKYNKYNNN